jgi:hypothetical protein
VNIAAYAERVVADPMTGEGRVHRQEWRVVLVQPKHWDRLRKAFGDHHRIKKYVLLHRYVKGGVEVEPWAPFDTVDSKREAFFMIDSAAVPVDPEMVRARDELAKATAEKAEKDRRLAESAELLRVKREELAEVSRKSEHAFFRLGEGSADGKMLCNEWNAMIARLSPDKDFIAKSKLDRAFLDDYAAVATAMSVPAKRKALRTFFKRLPEHERRIRAS